MLGPVDDIAFQARLRPEQLALVELASGRHWSYVALDGAVGCCAAVLVREFGLGRGERIASLARNRAVLPILHAACARLGAIYVPLNWRLAEPELEALVSDAEPRALLRDSELDALEVAMAKADPLPPAPIDGLRPSLILYTSGTSGRPKGVLLSERNLGETARNFGLLGRVTATSSILVDAPMFHVIGLVTNIRPVWRAGGTVLISDRFDPPCTLARLADPALAVTHWFGVPQMAAMLRADRGFAPGDLRHMTGIFTGGAPHPSAAIRAWLADNIAIVDGYGLSEAGTVFGMPPDLRLIAEKAGAVGVPTAAVKVRIVDSEDRDCAPGDAGELLIKGDNVFAGYWRREAETARAFTPDGWFRTGDIALCDTDGFFTIVDRKKDMFISGGENVYPAEIESALSDFPGIAEAAVVGVADERWGEAGLLALVPHDGAEVAPDAVLAWLGERLARYKLPKHVHLVERLPRTASGKVQKALLRTELASIPAAPPDSSG
jgi:fatty-acyl-CoA synthase